MAAFAWQKLDRAVSGRVVAWIAVAALATKLLLLFVALPLLHGASPSTYQADRFPDWYDMLATNLAAGNGYRFYPDTTATMLRTPGWPLILAGLFSVFGYGLTAVKVFNVLCSVGTAFFTYSLGARISGSRLLAVLAALVAFLHPAVIVADSRGGVESLFMLLLMLFMWLMYRVLSTDSLKGYLLAGATLGAILLVKSTAVLFAPCVFLCQIVARPTKAGVGRAFVTTALMSVAATLVLSPWIIRNYRLSGEFVPTMSVGSMAAWCGLYIATNRHTGREQFQLDLEASNEMGKLAESMGLKFKAGYYPQFYDVNDEFRFYKRLGEMVRETYRDSPGTFFKVLADNAAGFWVRGRTMKATMLNTILVVPFLVVAVIGAVTGLRRRLPVLPIVLFIGAFVAAHLTILGQARYHVPLIPLLAILFSLALLHLTSPGRAQD
jgi:hypothetical protein